MGLQFKDNPDAALAGATAYLRLFAIASGGVYLGRGALLAARPGSANATPSRQISLAKFFAEMVSPTADGLMRNITEGSDALLLADAGLFAV